MAEGDEAPETARSRGAGIRRLRMWVRVAVGPGAGPMYAAAAVAVSVLVTITVAAWLGSQHRGRTVVGRSGAVQASTAPGASGAPPGPGVSTQPPVTTPDVPGPAPAAIAADGPPPPAGSAEPPLPAGPSAALTVQFIPSTRWDGGVVGYFAITNTTLDPVDGWTLVVTVPADLAVTAAWEATVQRDGNTITFNSTSSNARIEVGGTVRFTVQVSIGRTFTGPSTCMINGAACA